MENLTMLMLTLALQTLATSECLAFLFSPFPANKEWAAGCKLQSLDMTMTCFDTCCLSLFSR